MEEKENIEELKTDEVVNELPKKDKKKSNKEIEALKNENGILNDKILRLNAEVQNIRRRYDDEISRIYKYDGEEFIKKLLPVIDNFERAIDMDDSNLNDEVSKFLNGFKMIYGNLSNTLKEYGIEEIDCLNKEFDPNEMNAVFTEHVDGVKENMVIDLLQRGYKYNDKVIRPAMVKVSE